MIDADDTDLPANLDFANEREASFCVGASPSR
jgi:hypothetical protein